MLYVVTTNYDWHPRFTSDSLEDQIKSDRDPAIGPRPTADFFLDIDGSTYLAELEQQVRAVRQGPLFPHVQLNLGRIDFLVEPNKTIPYNLGAELYYERHYQKFADEFLLGKLPGIELAHLPPTFTHFDLLFNFLSNQGRYQNIIALLKEEKNFDVKELEIYRPNTPLVSRSS